MRVPRYNDYRPASAGASNAARASSGKRDTKAELTLRRVLWALGLRYRVDARDLPGRPDIVFRRARVAVFVDGDFWHGRNLGARVKKLSRGHNAPYWVAKIRANVERDRARTAELEAAGWLVIRAWETDVHANVEPIAHAIHCAVAARLRV